MHILLYDDHNFVTNAIATYIRQQTDFYNIYECHTVDEVKHYLEIYEVDFIVSDVLSDEDAGFTIFEHLAKKHPYIKVIAYTSITNPYITKSLLGMGVSAVVNKKTSLSSLWEKIQNIVVDSEVKTKNVVPNMYLTNREKQIALLLVKGLAAKEIGTKLGSSPNTVNNQKNAMLEKFDCTNSTELIIKLGQMGLITII